MRGCVIQHSMHRTPRRAPRCAPLLRAAARPFSPQPIHKRAAGNGFLVCGGAGSFAQCGALALNTAAAPPPSRHRALAPRALAPTPRADGRAQPQERSAPPHHCARGSRPSGAATTGDVAGLARHNAPQPQRSLLSSSIEPDPQSNNLPSIQVLSRAARTGSKCTAGVHAGRSDGRPMPPPRQTRAAPDARGRRFGARGCRFGRASTPFRAHADGACGEEREPRVGEHDAPTSG